MKTIKMKNSDKFTLVDDEDYNFLNRLEWISFNPGGGEKDNYPCVKINGWHLPMHSLLLYNDDSYLVRDHIDRDKYNNQKDNLRLITHSENNINSQHTKGKSNYNGVRHYKDRRKKWAASISLYGKRHHLGFFHTAKEAARVWDNEMKKHYNNPTILNFPENT